MTVAIRRPRAVAPSPRIVYLPEPAVNTSLALVDPQVAVATARRQEMKARLLQDKARRDISHAADQVTRAFWGRFGLAVGGAATVHLALAELWAVHTFGSVGAVLLPATFLAGMVAVLVVHRCVFTLHHGHR